MDLSVNSHEKSFHTSNKWSLPNFRKNSNTKRENFKLFQFKLTIIYLKKNKTIIKTFRLDLSTAEVIINSLISITLNWGPQGPVFCVKLLFFLKRNNLTHEFRPLILKFAGFVVIPAAKRRASWVSCGYSLSCCVRTVRHQSSTSTTWGSNLSITQLFSTVKYLIRPFDM